MSETLCQHCGKRPQTGIWAESVLAHVHGMSQRWCEYCMVEAQLAHAIKAAENIPELRKRLDLLRES